MSQCSCDVNCVLVVYVLNVVSLVLADRVLHTCSPFKCVCEVPVFYESHTERLAMEQLKGAWSAIRTFLAYVLAVLKTVKCAVLLHRQSTI